MPLVYAGIDEAGYGPLLGPLCVGMVTLEVGEWSEGEGAPDLWSLLSRAVCRKPGDKHRRIAVDDSKALKLSNSSATRHPLVHLERGVSAFLACCGEGKGAEDCAAPCDDTGLFQRLGAALPREAWYACASAEFPVGLSGGEAGIAASVLRGALAESGVRVRRMSCEAMGESVFNEVVTAGGSKAAATEAALAKHLWTIWDGHGRIGVSGEGAVRVVCDRQGGRTQYTQMLSGMFPGAEVVETHCTQAQSRYEIRGSGEDGEARGMTVLFMTESESAHLPVALASMTAKLVREMMMARFNRYWCERMPELKPTAGYRTDARRWLDDTRELVSPVERTAMMRVL